jgi:hypothetical protein
MDVELLHPVERDFRLVHIDSLAAQVSVNGVHIGSTNEKARVFVTGDPVRIGGGWSGAVFIGSIQHQVDIIPPQLHEVVIWRDCVRIRLHNLEPRDITVKLK